MNANDLKILCQTMNNGNVVQFCDAVGISRVTYYASLRTGKVSETTALKVTNHCKKMNDLERRVTDLESKINP